MIGLLKIDLIHEFHATEGHWNKLWQDGPCHHQAAVFKLQ